MSKKIAQNMSKNFAQNMPKSNIKGDIIKSPIKFKGKF